MEHYKNISLENIVEEIEGIIYTEQWKDINDYEGHYMISNFGRVKSLERQVPHSHSGYLTMKERIMSSKSLPSGYITVCLTKDGIHKMKSVHRLVGVHFLDNYENLPEVNHNKGIKHDNRWHQLSWVTSSQNQLHSYKELNRKKADINGKLNPNYGNYKIFLNLLTGIFYTRKELCDLLGIKLGTMSCARNNRKEFFKNIIAA